MKRVGDNPPPRFPQRPVSQAQYPWWIAKVKPRQEKAFAFDLLGLEIEYYLPMYTKVTRRKDNNKPRKSVIPLFPGYVPFCAPKNEERQVYTTDRAVNLVEVRNQSRFIDELDQIYYTLEHGMPLEPLASIDTFAQGMEVKVQRGPLRGLSGKIMRIKGTQKLVLSVEGLGRAAVTVDAGDVRPA